MCEKSNRPPTGPQLQHAIKRNFGGLEDFDTYEIFKLFVHNIEQSPDLSTASEMVKNCIVYSISQYYRIVSYYYLTVLLLVLLEKVYKLKKHLGMGKYIEVTINV